MRENLCKVIVRLIGWPGQLSDHQDHTGSLPIREARGRKGRMTALAESCTHMKDEVMPHGLVVKHLFFGSHNHVAVKGKCLVSKMAVYDFLYPFPEVGFRQVE